MKTVSAAITILLPLLVASVSGRTVPAPDYCAPSLCPRGQTHIGCRNNGGLAPACPPGLTQIVTLTNEHKAAILHSHNTKRNTIAGGKLPGFKPAVRMATMRWDDELALLASYNVKTCKFAHDQCHNTNAFKTSGQNLAKFMSSGVNLTDSDTTFYLINLWWDEYINTNMTDIEKFPPKSIYEIGHFTVMTAEKNTALGCAAIRFPEGKWNSLTLACNYATTNIIGRPLYMPGPTASMCKTGTDKQYPALCSKMEKYD